MEKPKLYMMSGRSGCGKTTFARKYAQDHGLVYYGTDDFYRMFHGDERIHKDEFEIWMTIFRVLHTAEINGTDVMFDTNNLRIVDRVQILDWFPGFECHLFYIHASPELCVKNNVSRRRVIPPEEMERIIKSMQIPAPDEDERYAGIKYFENKENVIREALYHDLMEGRDPAQK